MQPEVQAPESTAGRDLARLKLSGVAYLNARPVLHGIFARLAHGAPGAAYGITPPCRRV